MYGRPKQTSDTQIDSERLNILLDAEHHLFMLKSAIWGDASYATQNTHLDDACRELRKLKVMRMDSGQTGRDNTDT